MKKALFLFGVLVLIICSPVQAKQFKCEMCQKEYEVTDAIAAKTGTEDVSVNICPACDALYLGKWCKENIACIKRYNLTLARLMEKLQYIKGTINKLVYETTSAEKKPAQIATTALKSIKTAVSPQKQASKDLYQSMKKEKRTYAESIHFTPVRQMTVAAEKKVKWYKSRSKKGIKQVRDLEIALDKRVRGQLDDLISTIESVKLQLNKLQDKYTTAVQYLAVKRSYAQSLLAKQSDAVAELKIKAKGLQDADIKYKSAADVLNNAFAKKHLAPKK